jgi:gliding motility-associated-like protein
MRSNKGCYAIFYDSVNVYPNPEAAFSILTERPTILQNNVGFLDSSTNAATLEWDFGDGSDLVFDEFEWYHTYADTGNYRVQLAVVSFDGCTDTTSRIIRIWPDFNILLPTAFSPNADGINDVYHIRGNHHSITTAIWQVYTEDGIKVFESNDIEGGWNGQLMNNGKPLPMGNYQLNLVVKDMYGNQSQLNEKIAIIR